MPPVALLSIMTAAAWMWLVVILAVAVVGLGVVAAILHWVGKDEPARRSAADAIGLRPQDVEWSPAQRCFVAIRPPCPRPANVVSPPGQLRGRQPRAEPVDEGSPMAVALAARDAERELDTAIRRSPPCPALGRLRIEIEAFKARHATRPPIARAATRQEAPTR